MLVIVAACGGTSSSLPPADGGPPAPQTPCVYTVRPARGFIGNEVTLGGDFGDVPVQVLLDGGSQKYAAVVRSWSPTAVVITVPTIGYGTYGVQLSAGCMPSQPPTLQVVAPPRVYIDDNVNGADGFDTITTLAYDPISGALAPMGPPTSTGLPAAGRPGCRGSLALGLGESRLYASGDTGVAVLAIDPATGALSRVGTAASGSTGGGRVGWTLGAYVWQATDGGIFAWRVGTGGLLDRIPVTTSPAAAMTLFGDRPSLAFTSRGDRRLDAWSLAYEPQPGLTATPRATLIDGWPVDVASNGAEPVYLPRTNDRTLLWVPTAAGLGVWQIDPQTQLPHELTGSPVPLAAPSGALGTPLFTGMQVIYMASVGSGYLAAAQLDAARMLSVAAGSPWNFAPDLTNLSCIATIPGPTPDANRLLAVDAGNRRIGVFDLPAGGGRPVPVVGSPFVLTETPAELASGIAVLQ